MTTDIHSCSYFCTRPACVLAQRDELRDNALESVQMAVLAEREACARIADEVGDDDEDCHAWTAADAIRARGRNV